MTIWDGTAIILLGTAGFAFSYDALRQIAIAIHARESLSYLFPVFIDGFIAYGVRALVLLRNRDFGARLYVWFLFLAATGASLWANALHAITLNHEPKAGRSALHLADSIVGVLSTLAPLALAGSVHLFILMARTAELSVRDRTDSRPGPVRQAVPSNNESTSPTRQVRPRGSTETASVPDIAAGPSTWTDRTEGVRDRPGGPPGMRDSLPGSDKATENSAAARPSAPETVRGPADGEEPPVPDHLDSPQDRKADDEWMEQLLPIARAASERAGRISRDTVKKAVRAHYRISNDRLGLLLARLKEEEDATGKTPAGASSSHC